MTEAIVAIKYWGNSLGVRLPAAVVREARLNARQQVRITVEDGRVVITPLARENLSLEQRLARFDSQRHGGEAMARPEVGAERW
ncbi:antitoxin MazE [Aromatoleum tolulyticum]|uniref:Antitoxin MazE n=1 Tax=Aromatoleum tolulyticum TaxID=34027 RepID=A0A1N6NVU0_9RHOO|nr:AbrB/MazE/SpoVT family DNA-binding domain-containing protein [Aromatoleum tolulyticum]SIP96116.1 antitoxin MazE [Aromatoleum tolulyticum]